MSDNIELASFIYGFATAGLLASALLTYTPDYKEGHQDGYKQGQIDCIEGRVKYMPDTTTTYIEVPQY